MNAPLQKEESKAFRARAAAGDGIDFMPPAKQQHHPGEAESQRPSGAERLPWMTVPPGNPALAAEHSRSWKTICQKERGMVITVQIFCGQPERRTDCRPAAGRFAPAAPRTRAVRACPSRKNNQKQAAWRDSREREGKMLGGLTRMSRRR